ncbi:MAG: DUF418 domain-containing protein [Pseudomonadales bacterium]|nr:DUF418 domain-containing protein [Pseudomonadales bacterium]
MIELAPAEPRERIEAIDTIRGFALLGILLLNILAFGLPFRAYTNPTVDGAVEGVDFGVFFTIELLFEGSMRALFSMLFGVGIAMFAASGKGGAFHYRRQLLLFAFGLVDGFLLLWTGDILTIYAMAGMVLYFCRNWRARSLLTAAGCMFAYLIVLYTATFATVNFMPDQAAAAAARIAAAEAPSPQDQAVVDAWGQVDVQLQPPTYLLEREARKFQGTYAEAFVANAQELRGLLVYGLPVLFIWDAMACMLLGMALYRTGVLTGQRSVRFYTVTAILALAIGVATNAFELAMKIGSGYAPQWVTGGTVITYDIGRVAMAIGFLSLTMIAYRRGWLARLRHGLAAVGRMALSNYILQSVFGFLIFRDLGLGLWNDLDRHELYYVVAGQWFVMIAFSLWWLDRYRFGPLEWLWRSLTYGRRQPMALRPA